MINGSQILYSEPAVLGGVDRLEPSMRSIARDEPTQCHIEFERSDMCVEHRIVVKRRLVVVAVQSFPWRAYARSVNAGDYR